MSTPKVVSLHQRHEYGHVRLYPRNTVAGLFCKVAGRKVFTVEMIEAAQELGFKVEIRGDKSA